jgi:hypothetical protein
MGKYLEALKLLYGDDEKSCETPKTRTDKTDRSPFVSNVSSSSGGVNEILPKNEQESIPFTDHEIAEHKINELTLRDDCVFVRQMLLGAYGKDRLALVNLYFDEWRKGAESEPIEVKRENAGRRRANTWLRQERGKDKIGQLTATVESLQEASERSETEPG